MEKGQVIKLGNWQLEKIWTSTASESTSIHKFKHIRNFHYYLCYKFKYKLARPNKVWCMTYGMTWDETKNLTVIVGS